MSENKTNSMALVVGGLVIGALIMAGLFMSGVFSDDPGVKIDGDGIEVNLPK